MEQTEIIECVRGEYLKLLDLVQNFRNITSFKDTETLSDLNEEIHKHILTVVFQMVGENENITFAEVQFVNIVFGYYFQSTKALAEFAESKVYSESYTPYPEYLQRIIKEDLGSHSNVSQSLYIIDCICKIAELTCAFCGGDVSLASSYRKFLLDNCLNYGIFNNSLKVSDYKANETEPEEVNETLSCDNKKVENLLGLNDLNCKVIDRSESKAILSLEENVPPNTPTWSIIRAILFVPGVLVVFLLSIGLMVAVASAIIGIIIYLITLLNVKVVPTGIILLLILGVFSGVIAILKGVFRVFWRKNPTQPAFIINLRDEPYLDAFITKLCSAMGTKKPKSVILHAESTFFVTSGSIKTINGKARGRVLAIGLPSMGVLTISELRAILAHEFAHFTGKDTIYSSVVSPIYISTVTACREMASVLNHKSEDSNWMSLPLIIPYKMLDLYLRVFHSFNMQISRLREQRADVIATITCGTNSFSMGLRKVIAYSGAFDYQSKIDIINELKKDMAYVNYYEEFRRKLPQLYELASVYDNNALNEQDNQNLSHPVLANRLNYIPSDIDEKFSDNDELALSLFKNIKTYEEELTGGYTQYVAKIESYTTQANNVFR